MSERESERASERVREPEGTCHRAIKQEQPMALRIWGGDDY